MASMSTTVKPTEVKREEFRKYLEHHGVMDALTTVLLSLYEEHERPDDALEYIRRHFAANDVKTDFRTKIKTELESEVESLTKRLADAKLEISDLKEKLDKYESENAA